MIENKEYNINDKIHQKALGILASFDKNYLERIRTGHINNYGEHAQSEYYHQLVKEYLSNPQDARELCFQALELSYELNNPKKSTIDAHNEWTIAPHIIANCDCIVGTMQSEIVVPDGVIENIDQICK